MWWPHITQACLGPEVWGGPCPRLTPSLVTRHRGADEGWQKATRLLTRPEKRGWLGTGTEDTLPLQMPLKLLSGLLTGPAPLVPAPLSL